MSLCAHIHVLTAQKHTVSSNSASVKTWLLHPLCFQNPPCSSTILISPCFQLHQTAYSNSGSYIFAHHWCQRCISLSMYMCLCHTYPDICFFEKGTTRLSLHWWYYPILPTHLKKANQTSNSTSTDIMSTVTQSFPGAASFFTFSKVLATSRNR